MTYSIQAEHISKSFDLNGRRITVLHDISCTVSKGEFLGVVGKNGSGKTTLLRILSNIYQPDTGNLTVKGSVVPFLGLGAGFEGRLTVRQNIFLHGIIMGFSRDQVSAHFADVLRFAELEDFVDAPLLHLSSGMKARLGFALAIQVKSPIILLDEVLAVGDASFRRKCLSEVKRLHQSGATIVFASHALHALKNMSDRVLHLRDGKIEFLGDPAEAIASYTSESQAP